MAKVLKRNFFEVKSSQDVEHFLTWVFFSKSDMFNYFSAFDNSNYFNRLYIHSFLTLQICLPGGGHSGISTYHLIMTSKSHSIR